MESTIGRRLREAVDRQDTQALEQVCLRLRTYAAVRAAATAAGVDLDELEELLGRI